MLSACHLYSAQTVTLQLVVMQVCSRWARGPGQRPLTDTAGPQLPEVCRLMTWVRSCQATGNNNPGTSFSAIAKKLKLICVNCRAGWFEEKHFEDFFLDTSSPQWRFKLWRQDHVAILKRINQEHLKSREHEQRSQEHKQSDKCSTPAPKGICWNLS